MKPKPEETKLERIRLALRSAGLPPWASWIDLSLHQENAEMESLRTQLARAREALEAIARIARTPPQSVAEQTIVGVCDAARRAPQPATGDLLIANPIGSKISRKEGGQ